jgi:hypothetical protein
MLHLQGDVELMQPQRKVLCEEPMPIDLHGLLIITLDLPAFLTLPCPQPHLILEHVALPVLHHPILRPLNSDLLAQAIPTSLQCRALSLRIFDLEDLSDHALSPGVCVQPMQAECQNLSFSFLSQRFNRIGPKLK